MINVKSSNQAKTKAINSDLQKKCDDKSKLYKALRANLRRRKEVKK